MVKYLILSLTTALAIALLVAGWQQGKIDKLNTRLGKQDVIVQTHLATIANKDRALTDLVALNKDCTEKRVAAANRAVEAAKQQLKDIATIKLKTAERVHEIKNEMPESAVCVVPVPPRVTSLLVEAARSANRGQDGQ